jgi:hypothetical protein
VQDLGLYPTRTGILEVLEAMGAGIKSTPALGFREDLEM